MSKEEFHQMVWSFGCSGCKAFESCSENQKQVIALAWYDGLCAPDEKQADEVINSYYTDFLRG